MSVIGLRVVLTQRLIRTKSFQAGPDSTTSRGADGLVLHSGSYSTQNSTQPIGGRVDSPTAMYSGRSERSSAMPAFVEASSPSVIAPTAALLPGIDFVLKLICPTPSRQGHVSHKDFAVRLSRILQFEVKSVQ